MPTDNNPVDLSTGTLCFAGPETNPPETTQVELPEAATEWEPFSSCKLSNGMEIDLTGAIEFVKETSEVAFRVVARICEVAYNMTKWGVENRPKLTHLAVHAKTARRRTKNLRRIIREYMQEVNNADA